MSAFGKTSTSLSDGIFILSGLSTIRGSIAVRAKVIIAGKDLGGLSASFAPVLGGVINVGDLRLLPILLITSVSPKSIIAGTVASVSVTGVNLSASTFSFAPDAGSSLSVSSVSINAAGTGATFTLTINAGASGRFTLVGTNPAGPSDPTPLLGFLPGTLAFNAFTIPGSDPNGDPDGDGSSNSQEITQGTDPLNADTDGDRWPDGLEVALGSDPLNPLSIPVPKNHFTSTFLFSSLNTLNPAQGITGSKQYVSNLTFSVLNALNPSAGISSKQYISSLSFSIINNLNPSQGVTGSTRYVSNLMLSILNALNPTVSLTGFKQYIASPPFSILNGIRPASTTTLPTFVNGLLFSIANGLGSGSSASSATLLATRSLAARTAQPWLFTEQSLGLLDSDRDGISDVDEIRIGTNPFDPDSDHDGFPDGLEIALGSNPLDAKSIPDINRKGFAISPEVLIQNYIRQAFKSIPPPLADSRRSK